MKATYTPGPWKLDYPIIKEANGNTVLNLKIGSRNDAILITEAPELLEVLKEFINSGPNAGHNKDLIKRATDAIAKVEGES